jgi:branched-subunit amino acid ABC-type transport system permease component
VVLAVTLETFKQLTASGIINGAAYGLLGVGFALILGVTGRFHFAFSVTYTLAAYLIFTFFDRSGFPFWVAVALGLVLITAIGVLVERAVYRPLAARAGATALLAIFVGSLGIAIAGENLIRLLWGSDTKALLGLGQDVWEFSDVIVFNYDVYQVLSAVGLVVVLTLVLRYTPLGRAIKATRVNPEMAQIIGINPNTIYLVCFGIGTFLCGVAALWGALRFSVEPSMGFKPVIFAFVVAFLAGTARSPMRVLATGFVVALIEQWSSIWLSVRWTQTAVFVILVAYLVSLSVEPRKIVARVRSRAVPARAAA